MKKYLPLFLILIIAGLLRLVALDKFPAGLNADEAAIGYNAWSLLQTGRDEHSVSWPLVFRSFDDYKPPVYFYLVLPFVKILGLNIWAVRLPSAILGVASVFLIFLLAGKLVPKNKYFPYLSAFLLAISPWHLQFSRGGWEVNAALFFILLGIWAFFKALERPKFIFLFVVALALSLYTYHSARLISPLLALSLVILYWPQLFQPQKLKLLIGAAIFGFLLSLPLASQLLSKEGQSRFAGVSVFADSGPLWQALELRRAHTPETIFVKALHNQYLSYGLRFVKNYLSHYSPRFLFIVGDEIARSKVPRMGESYLFLIPFYALGLFALLKLDSREKQFIGLWFLIAPLAAALTFQSPHALRAQNMLIPLTLITALGLAVVLKLLTRNGSRWLFSTVIGVLALVTGYSVSRYLHLYFVHYPQELPYAWQYGFDQVAAYTQANGSRYDHLLISDRYDQPYILMAFFLRYPPQTLQKELVMTPRDKFGFSTVRQFGKYEFRAINYEADKKLKNTLIMATDEPVDDRAVIFTIYDPAGKPMYKFIPTAK